MLDISHNWKLRGCEDACNLLMLKSREEQDAGAPEPCVTSLVPGDPRYRIGMPFSFSCSLTCSRPRARGRWNQRRMPMRSPSQMLATSVNLGIFLVVLALFSSIQFLGPSNSSRANWRISKGPLLGEQSKKQIISEAETLSAVVAHLVWMKEVEMKKPFLYVDNEGTKFSLIRGTTENEVVDHLVQIFAENEVHITSFSWIARVSSHSNIAEAASRGDFSMLLQLGFEDVSLYAMTCLATICATLDTKMGETAGRTACPHRRKTSVASCSERQSNK